MTALKVEKFERDSNFELCRIACIIYIVFYHLFIHVNNNLDNMWYTKPLTSIFHIGVVVFVMISGYYGIRRRFDKFLYIISIIVFYNLIFLLFSIFVLGKQFLLSDILRIFLPFSNGGYWFLKSYLVLYLLSPYVNMVLDSLAKKQFIVFLLILSLVVLYMGGVFSDSLGEGRGIMAFVLSYSIGRYIHRFPHYHLSTRLFKVNTFVLYILVCLLFLIIEGLLPIQLSKGVNHFFFKYNSIGLYFMSVLYFLSFKQLSFKSRFINYTAKSVLAVYLIHECSFIRDALIYKPFEKLSEQVDFPILLLVYQFLFALMIVAVCIGIDKIRERLYTLINLNKVFVSMNKHYRILFHY